MCLLTKLVLREVRNMLKQNLTSKSNLEAWKRITHKVYNQTLNLTHKHGKEELLKAYIEP